MVPAQILCLTPIRPRIKGWVKRFAGRRLEALSKRLVAANRAKAPYAIEYALTGTVLQATTPAWKFDRTADLRGFGAAVTAPRLIILLKRARAFRPSRILLFATEQQAQAVVDALAGTPVLVRPVPEQLPPGYD